MISAGWLSPNIGHMAMADASAQFANIIARCETAFIGALAEYARDAFHIGYRDAAIDGMARALVLLNYMEDHGRCEDSTIPLLNVAPKLQADGIYDEVLARARELQGVR